VVLLTAAWAQAARAAVSPLLEWEDPFWEGSALRVGMTDRTNDQKSTLSGSAQYTYGWESGFTLGTTIPLVLYESAVNTLKTEVPRIGGRVSVQTDYRVWGDATEYMGFEIGVGLPWQTDPSQRNTVNATWSGILAVFGRLDLGNWSLRGNITDQQFFPAENDTATAQVFKDQGNAVAVSVAADFFTRSRYSPFVGLSYSPPAGNEAGTINLTTGNPFLVNEGESPQARTVSAGLNFAPFKDRIVLTLQGDYLWMNGSPNLAPFQGSGRIRWVF
jgi:hypothetical protein